MTATDELRRLLDECGVEYTAPNSCLRDMMTCWTAGGFDYEAFEVPEPDGTFLLTAAHQDDLTPEQAVEATLGRGTCRMDRDEHESPFDGAPIVTWRCSECEEFLAPYMRYCPNCGRKVVTE